MPNTEIYLCEKKYFKKKYKNKLLIDLHFFEPSPNKEKKVCNLQAERMVKRTLTILPTWLIYPFYKSFEYFKFNQDHFVKNLSSNKDPYGLLDKYDCHFKFETNEIKKGQNFLKKYGLSSDSKFICLNVRDSLYLKKNFPSKDFSYHNYRDVNISIFENAVNELLQRNYFIFRVGKITNQSLKINHERYIDLTNSNLDDFFDLYLGAKCEICITTSSGFDSTPYVFRRKLIYLQVPISHFFSSSERYFIFTRYHFDILLKRNLTLKEIFEKKAHNADSEEKYKSKSISLISPSKEEIRDIIIEALNYFELSDKTEVSVNQKSFWKIYKNSILEDQSLENFHKKFRAYFSEIQINKLI
jgi:putative glycosyltransferase (TIGR04372 family)